MAAELLSMKNIHKNFGGTIALRGVDFEIKQRCVHALLGKNGAGKSTLVNIMMGVYPASEGEIFLNGKSINLENPHDAQKHGIAMVYQEFSLISDLSVAENIFLGRLPGKNTGLVDWQRLYREAAELLERLNFQIDPKQKVSDLSIADKQLVEIAGAISTDPNILILDEPTSALSESEIKKLFETIHLLKDKHDVGIVYISHRLQEVQQIADYLTVIRDGKIVADGGIDQFTQEEIVHFIVGEKVINNKRGCKNAGKEKVLEVKNLTRAGEFQDISFDLYEGEILGIAGLVGSKRTELIKALFGITCADSGKVIIDGKEISRPCPDKMIQCGMAYAPEDRKNEGIILDLSVNSNLSVANLKNISRFGLINHRKEKKINQKQIQEYEIKTAGLDVKINNLSGGNQQKVVLSKMLVRKPHIILLDEPTRGIDVGAKLQIFELLRKLAAMKVSIIFVSSEMEEVVDISDRILVIFNGKITEVIDSAEEVTVKEVVMKASCGN